MFSAGSMDSIIDMSNLTILSTKVLVDKDPLKFMIVTKIMVPGTGRTKTQEYSFKAENGQLRNTWVAQINKYTKNLEIEKLETVTEE